MNFVKRLKTKSILKTLLPVVLLGLFAAILLAGSQFWLFFQEPVNLHDVPRDELEGKYVTVDLPYIYGSYAYTEEYDNDYDQTGTVVAVEYLIDANYYDYCGLLVEDDDLIAQADALMEQSYAYDSYEISKITANFTVTGVMTQMPDDSLEFYHEAVGYYDMSAEEQEIFLPLYLDVRDGGDVTASVALLVLAAVLAAIAVFILIQAITGAHQKQLLQKAEQLSPGSPELILEQAQELYESQPKSKVKINSKLVFAQVGYKSCLYATGELVWAYHAVTRQRINFIPAGKSHSLVLAMVDGKTYQIPMSEKKVMELLQTIQQTAPGCFLGFNDQLAKIYKSDPTALVQMRATQMTTPQQQ